MNKIALMIIFLVLINFSSANIISYSCSGDNLKCYNPKMNENIFNVDVKDGYFASKINVDDNSKLVIVKVNDLTAWKNYWDIEKPTIKYTCNNWDWKIIQEKEDFTYEFVPGCNGFKVSAFSGYDYYSVLGNVKLWQSKGIVNVNYGMSPKGLKIPVMEFGTENPKYTVVMVVRQHPDESYSNWYLYGIMKQLYKGNPMLNDTRFLIFPIVNPDGVYYGKVRYNSVGQDLNDCWDKTTCSEVEFVKSRITEFYSKYGKIDVYLDWHGGNLGDYWNNTLLYETDTDKLIVNRLKSSTSFVVSSRRVALKEQSAGYMRDYADVVITPEIQMPNDKTNIPTKMVAEGERMPKIIYEYLVNNR